MGQPHSPTNALGWVRTASYGNEMVRYALGHTFFHKRRVEVPATINTTRGIGMAGTLCLVGGTFDRLHAGHRKLLSAGLDGMDSMQVWLLVDEIALAKDARILSHSERCDEVMAWAEAEGVAKRVTVHSLEDSHGPAPTDEVATRIVCTPETREECEDINGLREQAGLAFLEIVAVNHEMADDDLPISSSRIRAGTIDREGRSWLKFSDLESPMKMPEDLGGELKQPMGELHTGSDQDLGVAIRSAIEALPDDVACLMAVGDVCVKALLDEGYVPELALIDGMTKREPWDDAATIERDAFAGLAECDNPAGYLTPDLIECCDIALEFAFSEDGGPVLIDVDGEEDLAPIILHLLAPLRSAVLYGQPGEGVVLRITDEDTKSRCRKMLDSFVAMGGED